MTPNDAALLLGVHLEADRSAVEKAYRQHARLVHPDRFHDASLIEKNLAEKQFIRITDARAVLLEWIAETPPGAPTGPPGSTQPPSAHPRASSPPPSAPPKSREQYVHDLWSEEWTATPPPSAAQQPRSGQTPTSAPAAEPAVGTPGGSAAVWIVGLLAAVVAGVALAAIVMLIVESVSSSPGSAQAGGDVVSAAGQDSVEFTARSLSEAEVDASGGCSSASGCWMFDVSTDVTCAPGQHWAEVGFSATPEGVFVATRRYPLAQLNEYESELLRLDEGAPDTDYATVVDVYCQ